MNHCDICPRAAAVEARTPGGVKFFACAEHAPYLAGWVRDHEDEASADSIAAARAEESYR